MMSEEQIAASITYAQLRRTAARAALDLTVLDNPAEDFSWLRAEPTPQSTAAGHFEDAAFARGVVAALEAVLSGRAVRFSNAA